MALDEPKLGNLSDVHEPEVLNRLKFCLLLGKEIYLLKYVTVQHKVAGANMIASYKLVIALLTLGLKVHMHRDTHYCQEMYGASKQALLSQRSLRIAGNKIIADETVNRRLDKCNFNTNWFV